MNKLRFKYKIIPHRKNKNYLYLCFQERDEAIFEAGRARVSGYHKYDIFTCTNGWKIGFSSTPCVDTYCKMVYVMGTGGIFYNQASFLKTDEAIVIETLEDFRINYCHQDVHEPQHRLTKLFV